MTLEFVFPASATTYLADASSPHAAFVRIGVWDNAFDGTGTFTQPGRLFNDVGNVGAFVGVAGTGTNHRYDYVTAGVDGSYRLAWPKIPGRVHTGFYAYASYELRVAYTIARFDHLVSAGLSFAR